MLTINMWSLSKLIELRYRYCENILGSLALTGIREMFINQGTSCRTYRARTTRIAARHGRLDPLTWKYIRSRKRITESESYAIVAAHEGAYAVGKLNYAVDPRLLCRASMRILLCANARLGDIAAS